MTPEQREAFGWRALNESERRKRADAEMAQLAGRERFIRQIVAGMFLAQERGSIAPDLEYPR